MKHLWTFQREYETHFGALGTFCTLVASRLFLHLPQPGSWEAVQDAGGKTYWWNTETDEVTWSDPHVQAP